VYFSQRQTNLADADQVYRDSGASFHPFYATNAPSRHVEQITSATTSAEEFPWRSIKQGLDQVPYIFPGTLDEQSSELKVNTSSQVLRTNMTKKGKARRLQMAMKLTE
jgi:hypothetical protein